MAPSIEEINDINQMTDYYNAELTSIMNQLAPVQEKTIKVRLTIKWFTPELSGLKKHKRFLEANMMINKTTGSIVAYKAVKTTYSKALCVAKRDHIDTLVTDAEGDMRKLYSAVNNLMDRNQTNILPS